MLEIDVFYFSMLGGGGVNNVFSYRHSNFFTSFLWRATKTGIYIMVNEREIPDNYFLRSLKISGMTL
jgi:hypothetical protein